MKEAPVELTPPSHQELSGVPTVGNLPFIEELYADYIRDPDSLDPEWRDYFDNLLNGDARVPARFGPSFKAPGLFSAIAEPAHANAELQDRVNQLVRNYRVRGHRIAQVNPLGMQLQVPAELQPEFYHFTEAELDTSVRSAVMRMDKPMTVREIIALLQDTYCRSIGVQYMHIDDLEVRRWLQRRMEIFAKSDRTHAR